MKQVLVTGGAGYVGSHACKALARAGFTPVTYDNIERGHAWAVKWGPLECGDLLDPARLDAAFSSHEITAVIQKNLVRPTQGICWIEHVCGQRRNAIDFDYNELALAKRLFALCLDIQASEVEALLAITN